LIATNNIISINDVANNLMISGK